MDRNIAAGECNTSSMLLQNCATELWSAIGLGCSFATARQPAPRVLLTLLTQRDSGMHPTARLCSPIQYATALTISVVLAEGGGLQCVVR
jgi:hypothetical protein